MKTVTPRNDKRPVGELTYVTQKRGTSEHKGNLPQSKTPRNLANFQFEFEKIERQNYDKVTSRPINQAIVSPRFFQKIPTNGFMRNRNQGSRNQLEVETTEQKEEETEDIDQNEV